MWCKNIENNIIPLNGWICELARYQESTWYKKGPVDKLEKYYHDGCKWLKYLFRR